eukprot:XP_004940902.1 acrosomal protein KIAA1210 homolog isoform X3 [Gallus gallus]
MATGPTDVIQSPEPGETTEEYAGKKKSRFQTFKNFFAKKKRKEPPPPRGESNLKPSQSIRDVSIYVLDANALHSPKEAGPKGNMGNKALSHDSVFIFESVSGSAAGDTSSQECIPGRVKALQLQLQQNIRLGSPPLVITGKKMEDAGTVSEDDGLPRSPPDISTLHEVLTDSPSKSSNPVQRHSSLSLGGTDSEDEQIPSEASSRPISPSASAAVGAAGSRGSSSLPIDFTIPASPLGCLDTSAARHRIAINPRRQKGFTNKSQQSQVEHIEKEACLRATPEKKGNPTELLESDQHKSDWEDLSAHVEHDAKGGGSKETPSVKCPADADPDSYSSTLVAEDSCTLLQEDACLPDVDHHCNAATSLLRPESPPVSVGEQQSAAVPHCSDEAAGELKLHQQNTNMEVSALPKSQQVEAGAVVLPGVLAADSFSSGMEMESITLLAYVAQRSPAKSVDQNVRDQEKGGAVFIGKVEASLGPSESCSNQSVLDTALSTSQVAVADSESSSDVKTVAVLKSENSSATKNDSETCENTEFQPSKSNAGKKIDTAASVLEADCVLPPSKLEVCFKAEIPCPVSKDNHVSQQTCASYASEKLSIESLASSSLAGLTCNVSSNDDCKEYQVSSTASQRKPEKDSQSSEENIQSLIKTAAAKPVRFTIAPAWQRSLSGGSNSKEDSYTRSSPTSPIRPELFEGITKEHAVIQDSMKNNSNRFDRDCKDGDLHLNSSLEWAEREAKNVENPFGVKLRRTSSLLKYQSESRAESPKLLPSAAPTASAAVKEDQKPAGVGKPPPSLPVSTTSFLKQADLEDNSSPKTRSEEGTKKQNGTKPSEKVSSLHLETASSEPAWISMAKLKQKGFQGHPLAKEQKAEEQTSSKVDEEEQVICGSENTQKNMPSSLRTQEKKPQMKTSVCAAAGKVGPIAQEASVIPAVEKETRHSSNLPMTPCSPAEPPWLSLAKKKAKAWSEMPQIVQ